MDFIDIGVNLTNSRFKQDRELVIKRAHDVGVKQLIITGTNVEESQNAHQLANLYSNTFSTAGCHPHDADNMTRQGFESIKELLQHKKVVAIGETGLDFNRNFSTQENQIDVFKQHLELACDLQKPLFIHERDAATTMLQLLADYSSELPNTVIHCFTGSEQTLKAYIKLDLYIGITGWICDERRGLNLANIVKLIPDDRLLLETDSPYLLPRDYKPKLAQGRNEPYLLPHIAAKVALCRQQSIEHVAKIAYQNTQHCFNLKNVNES